MPLFHWIPQQIGQEFGHCLSLSRPTNSTSVCSTSGGIAQRFHCYQGDPIALDFALVHQRVRDRTDEPHVDSEAEEKVLILCVVSIERRWLAQASQVLEQFGIKRFRHSGDSVRFQRTGSATMYEYKMTI